MQQSLEIVIDNKKLVHVCMIEAQQLTTDKKPSILLHPTLIFYISVSNSYPFPLFYILYFTIFHITMQC